MHLTLTKVYEGPLRLNARVETLSVYSFYWQYTGRRYYVEICPGAVVRLDLPLPNASETLMDISYSVYAVPGNSCWEEKIGGIESMVVSHYVLQGYYDLAENDILLGCIAGKYRGLTLKTVLSPWYALLVAVCQQNASFLQGWKMLYNIHILYNKAYRINEHIYMATPSPKEVNENLLREARLGYRVGTILEASKLFSKMDEGMMKRELPEILDDIPGIGPYTKGLVLLLSMAKLDVFIMDRWIAGLVAKAYNVSVREVNDVWRRRWGRWQGIASYHLTIAFDAEPLRKALKRLEERKNCPMATDKPSPMTLWIHSRGWRR